MLINKLDIRDGQKLAQVEADITKLRISQWELNPLADTFDFTHYKAIHTHLFSDLYSWAGQVRTVDLSKRGTRFCPAQEIETRAELIFARLRQLYFLRGMEHSDFVEELTDFYCSTNELHPFREGNGRTQRLFLSQLVRNAGYTLNFSEVDGDLLMFATIQAAQDVKDLLRQLLEETIRPQK
nr:Fic family protein [uncultured Oscillibacter sp.]